MPAVPSLIDCLAAVAALRGLAGGATNGCPIARVLADGRAWLVPAHPPSLPRMPLRECFRNATLLALSLSGWTYAEGYARRRTNVVRHAWLVDPAGAVGDPTWGWEPSAEYAGICFPRADLSRLLTQQTHYGVLIPATAPSGAARPPPPPLP